MLIGKKLYLKENINVFAKIVSKVDLHEIPHFQISIYRGESISEACISKHALEQFYQVSPHKKINVIKKIFAKFNMN